MIKFALKLLLLLGIVIVANNLLFKVFRLPFCWGNDIAYAKAQYFLNHSKDFNTVFIGTSKTYWEANVTLFDSLTNHKTRSFNYGVDAIAAAEMFYYTDNLVRLDKNIRYAFIELYDIDLIIPQNLHTRRQKYWSNLDSWLFTMRAIWDSNFNLNEKLRGFTNNTITFFEWLLKFDLLKDVVRFKSAKVNEGYLGVNQTGYVALGEEVVDTDEHLARHRLLLNDTSVNFRMAVASNRVFAHFADSIRFNNAYYNKLQEVINSLQSRNIKVFLIIAPRTNEIQLSNVVPAFLRAKNCDKINLAEARLNPEFYELNYSYDPTHLNKSGGRIYTEKIARAFNEAMAKNQHPSQTAN
jgi:hypothetical protein